MRKSGKSVCLFQLIPHRQFQELCDQFQIDKYTRKLTAEKQVWVLIMAFILKLDSLREVESVLGVPRSTLSDANAERSAKFFEALCRLVLWKIYEQTSGRKIRGAIRTLLALDSTECRVDGRLSKLPKWKQKYTKDAKASVKLHTIWNVHGEWIEDFKITPGRTSDSRAAKTFGIKANMTYVFDRAYNELSFWWMIVDSKSHFVSRLKKTSYSQWRQKKLLREKENEVGVLQDQKWKASYAVLRKNPQVPKDFTLRHITFKDPDTKRVFEFITSDLNASAQEIADIYRKRWAVELLFRWMKGHLKMRAVEARNTNAVHVLLAITVLVQLLVQLYRLLTKFKGTLWECLRALRTDWARVGTPAPNPKAGKNTPFAPRAAPMVATRVCYA